MSELSLKKRRTSPPEQSEKIEFKPLPKTPGADVDLIKVSPATQKKFDKLELKGLQKRKETEEFRLAITPIQGEKEIDRERLSTVVETFVQGKDYKQLNSVSLKPTNWSEEQAVRILNSIKKGMELKEILKDSSPQAIAAKVQTIVEDLGYIEEDATKWDKYNILYQELKAIAETAKEKIEPVLKSVNKKIFPLASDEGQELLGIKKSLEKAADVSIKNIEASKEIQTIHKLLEDTETAVNKIINWESTKKATKRMQTEVAEARDQQQDVADEVTLTDLSDDLLGQRGNLGTPSFPSTALPEPYPFAGGKPATAAPSFSAKKGILSRMANWGRGALLAIGLGALMPSGGEVQTKPETTAKPTSISMSETDFAKSAIGGESRPGTFTTKSGPEFTYSVEEVAPEAPKVPTKKAKAPKKKVAIHRALARRSLIDEAKSAELRKQIEQGAFGEHTQTVTNEKINDVRELLTKQYSIKKWLPDIEGGKIWMGVNKYGEKIKINPAEYLE